jgi:hypothetical protein
VTTVDGGMVWPSNADQVDEGLEEDHTIDDDNEVPEFPFIDDIDSNLTEGEKELAKIQFPFTQNCLISGLSFGQRTDSRRRHSRHLTVGNQSSFQRWPQLH